MRTRSLASGLISMFPGGNKLLLAGYRRRSCSTGSLNARYCYSVWMRHLVKAADAGVLAGPPSSVGELGPGNSLGVGLAALLSGSQCYRALDVVRHAHTPDNLRVLDELAEMFRARTPIPDGREFPQITTNVPRLDFPTHLLPDNVLEASLREECVGSLRRELAGLEPTGAARIHYSAPWTSPEATQEHSVDFFLSMSVLEHVDDLAGAYRAARHWLRPGGLLSNEIDFGSHGLADHWDGHWAFSRLTWSLIRGRRPYLINRVPLSGHLDFCHKAGFEHLMTESYVAPNQLPSDSLAREFRKLDPVDRSTRTAYLLFRG